jgi:hypothetical protein
MRLRVDRFSAAILVALGISLLLTTAGSTRSFADDPNTNFDLAPLQNIVQIDAGAQHTCALTNSGGVKCWAITPTGNWAMAQPSNVRR